MDNYLNATITLGTITSNSILFPFIEIYLTIVIERRFSSILIYISLIPIGTITSSLARQVILAPFLFILYIRFL